jgi:hypothetical protein
MPLASLPLPLPMSLSLPAPLPLTLSLPWTFPLLPSLPRPRLPALGRSLPSLAPLPLPLPLTVRPPLLLRLSLGRPLPTPLHLPLSPWRSSMGATCAPLALLESLDLLLSTAGGQLDRSCPLIPAGAPPDLPLPPALRMAPDTLSHWRGRGACHPDLRSQWGLSLILAS